MPTLSKAQESVVLALQKAKAFDRASGRTISSPQAAAPLVNAGALDKASKKPPGGSQTTVYWLTGVGQAMAASLKGPRCRHCGCTEMNACKAGCSWVKPGLCSNPKCVAADARKKKGR